MPDIIMVQISFVAFCALGSATVCLIFGILPRYAEKKHLANSKILNRNHIYSDITQSVGPVLLSYQEKRFESDALYEPPENRNKLPAIYVPNKSSDSHGSMVPQRTFGDSLSFGTDIVSK